MDLIRPLSFARPLFLTLLHRMLLGRRGLGLPCGLLRYLLLDAVVTHVTWTFEFKKNIIIPVSRVEIAPEAVETFEQEDFWKDFPTENEGAIVFTGTIDYRSEVRKALVDRERRQFEDPFPEGASLEERKFFTLFFTLYMIDSNTGETLYQRDFKETRNYKNPNQTAYFAYFDLIKTVKDKLFQAFLGEELLQERYLIAK